MKNKCCGCDIANNVQCQIRPLWEDVHGNREFWGPSCVSGSEYIGELRALLIWREPEACRELYCWKPREKTECLLIPTYLRTQGCSPASNPLGISSSPGLWGSVHPFVSQLPLDPSQNAPCELLEWAKRLWGDCVWGGFRVCRRREMHGKASSWWGCGEVANRSSRIGLCVCVQPFPTFVILGKHSKSWLWGPEAAEPVWCSRNPAPSLCIGSVPGGAWGERRIAGCRCNAKGQRSFWSKAEKAMLWSCMELKCSGWERKSVTQPEKKNNFTFLRSSRGVLASLRKSCQATGEPRARWGVPSLLLCSTGFFLLQAASVNHREVQTQQI